MKFKNILITGCADDIAQSIAKILRTSEYDFKIFGSDIHNNHPGAKIFDKCFLLPPCSNINYLKILSDTIVSNNIDCLFICSEPELRFYSASNFHINNVEIICADSNSRNICFDKFHTVEFLKKHNLPYPKTTLYNDLSLDDIQFPCIYKMRNSSGSKEIYIIKNQDDFLFYKKNFTNDGIIQELLSPAGEEYTCGIFRSQKGETRTIIFKRTLSAGRTASGELIYNSEISSLLCLIAEKLNLKGSINVQLIMTKDAPVVFEINPRFSSTVLFRHLLGFKDVIWSLEEHSNQNLSNFIPPLEGTKFYRGFCEYIVEES